MITIRGSSVQYRVSTRLLDTARLPISLQKLPLHDVAFDDVLLQWRRSNIWHEVVQGMNII